MNFREAREAAGMTQDQVAERMKVSQDYISNLENGKINPTVKTLKRYCEAIGGELEIKVKMPAHYC